MLVALNIGFDKGRVGVVNATPYLLRYLNFGKFKKDVRELIPAIRKMALERGIPIEAMVLYCNLFSREDESGENLNYKKNFCIKMKNVKGYLNNE